MGVELPNLEKLISKYYRLSESEMKVIARECCEEGQKILFKAMTENIESYIIKGKKNRKGVYKGGGRPMTSPVTNSPIMDYGDAIFGATGVQKMDGKADLGGVSGMKDLLLSKGADGKSKYRALWYREYGGKGWAPPIRWFRPAVDSTRGEIKKKWQSIMEAHGLKKS